MKAQALTVPNALSGLRLLLVPVVTWLIAKGGHDTLATCLLVGAAGSDWLDGWIARRWNQVSAIGTLLDPLADRIALICFAVALVLRDVLPLWVCCAIVARDVLLLALLPALRRAQKWALPVTRVGKAGTFGLLSALPLAFIGVAFDLPAVSRVAVVVTWLGTVLYWAAGWGYVRTTRALSHANRSGVVANSGSGRDE